VIHTVANTLCPIVTEGIAKTFCARKVDPL